MNQRQKLKQIKAICDSEKEFYRTKSKSNNLNSDIDSKYLDIVKRIMPYIEIKEGVSNLDYLWNEREKTKSRYKKIKLSEIIEINGPGIYIHASCRPFVKSESNVYATQTDSFGRVIDPLMGNTRGSESDNMLPLSMINSEITILKNKIANGAYKGTISLIHLNFGSNIELIGVQVFQRCSNLKTVTFYNDNKNQRDLKIKRDAFKNCISLEELVLPKRNIIIAENAFLTTYRMSSQPIKLTILYHKDTKINHKDVKTFFETEYEDRNIFNFISIDDDFELPVIPIEVDNEDETISKDITKINNRKHYGSIKLKTLTFNNSIEKVCNQAFMNCQNLTTVSFNGSIKGLIIQPQTFMNCSNLNEVSFDGHYKNFLIIQADAFSKCLQLKTLKLPNQKITMDQPFGSQTGAYSKGWRCCLKLIYYNDTIINESQSVIDYFKNKCKHVTVRHSKQSEFEVGAQSSLSKLSRVHGTKKRKKKKKRSTKKRKNTTEQKTKNKKKKRTTKQVTKKQKII